MQRIGELLVSSFGLEAAALEAALLLQKEKGGQLGAILVRQGAIGEEAVLAALGMQYGLEVRQFLPEQLDPFFVPRVGITLLKKFRMIPVATADQLFLAMAEPMYFQQADDLAKLLNWQGARTGSGIM